MIRVHLMSPALLSLMVATFVVASVGCESPEKDFGASVLGASGATSQERDSYNYLKASVSSRGDAMDLSAIRGWDSAISSVSQAMQAAKSALEKSKDPQKLADVRQKSQTALNDLKNSVDQILDRNYEEASLKSVPPWKMSEAQSAANDAKNKIDEIKSAYKPVFNIENAHQPKGLPIQIIEDLEILDTIQPCIDSIEKLSGRLGMSDFCNNAAKITCQESHQTDLSCLRSQFTSRAAQAQNMCPDVVTEQQEALDDGTDFTPTVAAGEQVKGKPKKTGTVEKDNPNRNVTTFCPGNEYDETTKTITSATGLACLGSRQKVRVYGYNADTRHVDVQVEGMTNVWGSDINMSVYVEGKFVEAQAISPNTTATFTINKPFQAGTSLKIKFPGIMKYSKSEPNPKYKTDGGTPDELQTIIRDLPAAWNIAIEIKGEDVPKISYREYDVTKYKPSPWVADTIRSCNNGKLILK